MKNLRKGLSFMLMFALVSIFALRTTSITASSGTTDSAAIDWTQTKAPDQGQNEVAAVPLVVAAAVAGGMLAGWAVSEVLHHHFYVNEIIVNNTEVTPVLEKGDKLFDL